MLRILGLWKIVRDEADPILRPLNLEMIYLALRYWGPLSIDDQKEDLHTLVPYFASLLQHAIESGERETAIPASYTMEDDMVQKLVLLIRRLPS